MAEDTPNGILTLRYEVRPGRVGGGVLSLRAWTGSGPIQLPAVCLACEHSFASGIEYRPGQDSADGAGPFICPTCGSEGRLPEPLIIEDAGNRRFELRRLDLLSKTLRAARGLSADELHQAVHLLREMQAAPDGPAATEAAKRSSPDRVRRLLDLVPQSRQDYYAFIGIILAVLGLIVAVLAYAKDDDEVAKVVVERTITQHSDVLAPDKGTIRLPPKVSRNAPCPCGSGRKHKHCCLPRPAGSAAGAPGDQGEDARCGG